MSNMLVKFRYIGDELGGIVGGPDNDNQPNTQFNDTEIYTISLISVLIHLNAPPVIDYFSLDVEGHEYRVLELFDFGLYTFNVMTIERPKIALHHLLVRNKYWFLRVMGNFGDCTYIHESIPNFRSFMQQYADERNQSRWKADAWRAEYLNQPVLA